MKIRGIEVITAPPLTSVWERREKHSQLSPPYQLLVNIGPCVPKKIGQINIENIMGCKFIFCFTCLTQKDAPLKGGGMRTPPLVQGFLGGTCYADQLV